MKRLFGVIALGALMLTGCQTLEDRIAANQEYYTSLSPAQQERVQTGQIELGDSRRFVRLALGEPDKVLREEATEGEAVHWVYKRRTWDYVYVGASTFRPARGTYGPYYYYGAAPRWVPVETYETALTLIFRDGEVSSILRPSNE